MRIQPIPAELTYFAFRVLERPEPNEWFALVAPAPGVEQVASALAEELRSIGGIEPVLFNIKTAVGIVESVRKQGNGVLVLSGFDAFGMEDWRRLDADRSLLQRNDASVLVLGEEALGQLFRHAPNLSSWLGGQAWLLTEEDHSLTPEERETRLASLRDWSGMTDAEVIAKAERGELPPEPPYAEWLVLLKRGELLD
ncbi:hypothetical protein [Archangium sp.]|uniref:hypothetical protein n=1 Tax=Archangium sp. TaxID=1872627 RepID=UPI002D65A8E6|nr:hypothetical protein [Archangium sp.]HYO57455.1 hypothetical protein [Archangium sp.]